MESFTPVLCALMYFISFYSLSCNAFDQVEDCTRDVCELSTYHFRYRICNVHIRLPAFMRQGKLQRFCQQCGRCHELSEFEGSQRSCRAQLDRHNARCLSSQLLRCQPLLALVPCASSLQEVMCIFANHYCRAQAITPLCRQSAQAAAGKEECSGGEGWFGRWWCCRSCGRSQCLGPTVQQHEPAGLQQRRRRRTAGRPLRQRGRQPPPRPAPRPGAAPRGHRVGAALGSRRRGRRR